MKRAGWVFLMLFGAGAAEANFCSWLVAPSNVVFGTYSVFGGGSLTATSTYTVRCNPFVNGLITFTKGANAPTYFPRYMRRTTATELIGYNLYDSAANTTVLGDGAGGTTTQLAVNGTPQAMEFTHTIYAATPQGSDVPPGTYQDTVTAILSWNNGAGSSSVTFTVTTVVQAECTVSTAAVNFGSYFPVGAHATSPLDGTGTVNVYCTPGTNATVSLGNGNNYLAPNRRMAGPAGSLLNYQLFRDSSRSVIWDGSNTVSGTAVSRTSPINGGFTAFGRVFAGQDPTIGLHTDTVQAVVNY